MKEFLGDEREVMRRLYMHVGRISLASYEPKLIAAAVALTTEGYFTKGPQYPAAGAQYHVFIPTNKVDHKKLRDL